MKIAVLGSTRGTDLQAILDSSTLLEGVEIAFVLSNKQNAYILERARKHDITTIYLSAQGKTREQYDEDVTRFLIEHDVDLILLIGYMKLMSNAFVQRWRNRVMNIHPSLLPAFAGGMDRCVHQAVLDRGCKVTGATLIFIDEGADTGPIISQEVVEVDSEEDTVDTLKAKVQAAEGRLLVDAIRKWRDGYFIVEGSTVRYQQRRRQR